MAARGEPESDRNAAARLPLFLERDTYRRRRLMDAARLLPAFGTALMLLPVLWAEGHSTAHGAVYLFLAWLCLIVAAAVLARRLSEPIRRRSAAARDASGAGGAGGRGEADAPRAREGQEEGG